MSQQPHPFTRLILSALLCLVTATAVHAQRPEASTVAVTPLAAPSVPTASAPPDSPPEAVGTQSRQWLNSQAQRQQASATRQTLSGPAMKAVHERYVRSFTTPIEPTSLHNRDPINSN